MNAQKRLIIIKGKDKTDSVASFRFHDGKCDVVYTSSPGRIYSFQNRNVEILPLKKQIDPAQVIVTANGQTFGEIDEILDFGAYYRIIRAGRKGLSFHRSEVQFQRNCLADGKNKEAFQYFKETAAAISLVTDNGINILKMQYDKIQQLSENTVLASYLAPQKETEAPRRPAAVIYPFGLNQSQKLAVERALSSKISIIQGPPGTGKTQTILNIIANVVRSGKTVAVVSNNNSATHNVAEKLEKKDAVFLTAFLGSLANKQKFLDTQTGVYPDMHDWEMPLEKRRQLELETTALSTELNEMLNTKNRIAEIEQELLRLNPEQHYFEEYYAAYGNVLTERLDRLPSQKILALWMEFEQHAERETRLGLLQKLSIVLRFNRDALRLFLSSPEQVIPYLQSRFYVVKRRELESEKRKLTRKLEHYAFDAKMDELTKKSLRLFRAELAARYPWKGTRKRFEEGDFRRNSAEFTREYPVVLSTTYSIKGTLSIEHVYDYLIVDEASQVDLTTGVLAFSCARNIVIVGDMKQLPNVLTEDDIRTSDDIWAKYSLDERYRFSTHSLLSSALETWQNAPVTLLREHYRCHPKIINFCNQKFYHGQLIIMTKDHDESDVLTMYRTAAGNHARGHLNQRQIDVIQQEVLPRLNQQNFQSIGIALIQLRRSHGRTVRCRERAGCTRRNAVDLLLQVVDLPAQLLGDLAGFLLPLPVDAGSRDQAAGSHQRHNKNGGDNGLPRRLAGSTGLFLPLLWRLRLGLVLILIRPGLAGHIGGIGVGRLPAARTGGVIGAGLGFALALLRNFIPWFLRSFVLRLLRGVETRFGSRVIFFRIFAICKGVHGGYLLLFSYPTLSVTYEEICIDM